MPAPSHTSAVGPFFFTGSAEESLTHLLPDRHT